MTQMESELLKISKEDFEKNKTLVHIVDNEEQNNFINDYTLNEYFMGRSNGIERNK